MNINEIFEIGGLLHIKYFTNLDFFLSNNHENVQHIWINLIKALQKKARDDFWSLSCFLLCLISWLFTLKMYSCYKWTLVIHIFFVI